MPRHPTGLGGKKRQTQAPLQAALTEYQAARERANRVWEIYDGQPSEQGATDDAVEKLREKFGGPLPADFEAFLRLHDGWEDYEYDRHIMRIATFCPAWVTRATASLERSSRRRWNEVAGGAGTK